MYSQISIGTNIRTVETLRKIDVKSLFDSIHNPKPDVANKVRELRIVMQLSPAKYADLKRQLPYFVCATFNPSVRKNANFSYTECFVIDIDHISEKGFMVSDVKEKVKADERVLMMYESPSGDGLKVIFHLKERCYDAGLYSIFYKDFALKFSELYGLQQVVDAKTSDVSRACFLSADTDAYFNPDSVAVDMDAYVDLNNPLQVFDLKKKVEKAVNENVAQETPSETNRDPDKETMDRIRQILNPKMKKTKEVHEIYVPEILNDIIDGLKNNIEEYGIEVTEIVDIQYGKKIKMRLGLKLADVNLFYGRRGFTVVHTPKTGTDAELNQLMSDFIECYVDELKKCQGKPNRN